MLISIAGSQGSGKTTLINELSKKFMYPTVERKTSRSILSDWRVTLDEVNSSADLTQQFQEEILKRKYDDDIGTTKTHTQEITITERTMIDLLLFATVNIGKDNNMSDWLNDYGDRCIRANKIYDFVFYLTAGHFDIEKDGVRGHNKYYSTMTDAGMLAFYKQYYPKDKLVIIDTPDIRQRIAIIQTTLMNYMYQSYTSDAEMAI